MSIDKDKFWDVNYYNHPPLTKEMIAYTEATLNIKLPIELIELLKIQNGGYTKGFAFPMATRTSWAENHVPLSELFGIVTDSTISTAQNILDTQYMTDEWGLPEKQVILCGDGHWWITLDYRYSDKPRIRWIDTECGEDIHISNSFQEFIDGLVSDEIYAED
ncbi:MAG TPA: SMI1/KNR4 family protein [Patescibacteria group bacterium]|nr:SMI1/KNR4 family protein [Patescibacteria group bacterium]